MQKRNEPWTVGGGRGVENWRWEIVAELTYMHPGGVSPLAVMTSFSK